MKSLLTDSEWFSRRRNEVLIVSGVTRGCTSRMKQPVQLCVEISHAFRTRNVQRVHRGIGSHDLQVVGVSRYLSLSQEILYDLTIVCPKSISRSRPFPNYKQHHK